MFSKVCLWFSYMIRIARGGGGGGGGGVRVTSYMEQFRGVPLE